MDETRDNNLQRDVVVIKWLAAVVALVAAVFALKVGQVFFAPLIFTLLIVMLVAPLQQRLDALFRGRYPALSIALTLLAIVVVLWIFVEGLWLSVTVIARHVPDYAGKFRELWLHISAWAGGHRVPVRLSGDQAGRIAQTALSSLAGILSSLSYFASRLGLIVILLVMSLVQLRYWQEKLNGSPEAGGREFAGTMAVVAQKLRRFLLIQTIINALIGASVGGWLLVMGIDLAPVLGILAFLLEYLPYVGSLVIAFFAALIALLQHGPGRAVIILAGIVVIYQVISSFISPHIQGRSVSVSPLLLFVSIIFWSWLWGVEGVLVALPLTIALVAASDSIPALRSLLSVFRTR